MAQEYYSVVTRKGVALEATSVVTGTPIVFTHIAVGDGKGLAISPSSEMESLVQERWRGQINDLYSDPDNANVWVATTVIPRAVGGFTIREAGLFTETGLMYAIGKTPNIDKVAFAAGAVEEVTVRIRVTVSPEATVHLLIDPSEVLATRDYVDREIEKHDKDPAAHGDTFKHALFGLRLSGQAELNWDRAVEGDVMNPELYQSLEILPRKSYVTLGSGELTLSLLF